MMLSQVVTEAANAGEAADAWLRLFNIDHPWEMVWIAIGLAGQSMFFLRMGIQWIMSERRGESIVPPVFWWCSTAGASMLLIYFIWRWDIVGLLGQSFGFVVYFRNLYLIYGKGRCVPVTSDVDPEPELAEPTITGRTGPSPSSSRDRPCDGQPQ